MEVPKSFRHLCNDQTIYTVDMHTTGEPIRIVYAGYPRLSGTLLEQRAHAQSQYDHIRKRLMWEPRGHYEMYGAILCRRTELVDNNEAHIGVLFMTNEGYSTMCGHATIALARFLLDCQDVDIFPKRSMLQLGFDRKTMTVRLNLHAPCGLVEVTVPVEQDGRCADANRPVSFVCVPSFTTAIGKRLDIPESLRWPELGDNDTLPVSISYGGAFFGIVYAWDLGLSWNYKNASQSMLDGLIAYLPAIERASRNLKTAINQDPGFKDAIRHPEHDELSFLYSIIVVFPMGDILQGTWDQEIGVCFFGDQQFDRSPTGSGVAARVALATALGGMNNGEKRTYHSLLSFRELVDGNASKSGAFTGGSIGRSKIQSKRGSEIDAVIVRIEGYAYYTGFHTFVVEERDTLGQKAFLLNLRARLQ